MGMFDTIKINSKCPVCGNLEVREYQTKDLYCELDLYNEGDCVGNKVDIDESGQKKEYLDAIGSCHGEECTFKGNICDILCQSIPSGFDMLWNCKIRLDENYCITNEMFDIEIIQMAPDDWEDTIKYRYGDYWEFLLEKYKGDKKKAIDEFGYGRNRRQFIIMVRKLDYTRLTWQEIRNLIKDEGYRRKEKATTCRTCCSLRGIDE